MGADTDTAEKPDAYPSRERCGWCGEYSAVSFWVPCDVWAKVVPERFRETVSCLRCFARMADERLVEWDREIRFFPRSLYRHVTEVLKLTVKNDGR